MANTDFTARCMAGKALKDIAGKQDVIADLDTIRAGAEAGATAVQPAELDNYQTKIDSTHKLDTDFVDDANSTNKFATQEQLGQIGINENNISSLSTLIPKVASATYLLNDLTWTASIEGMIYSNSAAVSGITSIYSAIITGFTRLRATDVIVPILSNDGTQIRFIANTNSWVTEASVTLRIVGV